MPRYKNGRIPLDQLVKLGPTWYLTPGTTSRWKSMVADVLKREGVQLRMSPGWTGYRPFEQQVIARQQACAAGNCNMAAVPGFSAHGGSFGGRDAMAIDVWNWAELGWNTFRAYCKKWGFATDQVTPQEKWHIHDYDPWTVPAPPVPPDPPTPPQEVFIMATEVIVTVKGNDNKPLPDNKRRAAFVNTDSGFQVVFSWLGMSDAQGWAKALGQPAPLEFSDAGLDAYLAALKPLLPAGA